MMKHETTPIVEWLKKYADFKNEMWEQEGLAIDTYSMWRYLENMLKGSTELLDEIESRLHHVLYEDYDV